MSIKNKLQDVYESIQSVKPRGSGQLLSYRNPLKGILPYELKSLIEESPVLEEEFKRRAYYYQNLAKDQSYLDFIAGLHQQMREIQSLIDAKKLASAGKLRLKRPKYIPFDDKDGEDRFWIELQELHTDLSKDDKWWNLGQEGMPPGGSLFTPWHYVLEQYEIVLALMEHAYKSGALKDDKQNYEMYTTFKKDIQALKEMFEKPLHQLHINEFEHLAHCMLAPECMSDDEKDIERVKGYVDRVYKDLMLFLDELDNETILSKPLAEIRIKKDDKIIVVNGLTINMENQKVSHPQLGSKDFKAGFIPWTILRICAKEEPDGLGKASLETLGIAESDIHKKLNLINKHYSAPIVHYKNGMVYLDPDFKK